MVLSIWTTTHWGWLGLVIGFRSLFRLHSPCQVSVGRLGEDLLNTCQCWLLCTTPVQNTSRIIRISWTLMKLNIDELLINLAHCPTYAIIFHSMTNLWRIILDNIYIYIMILNVIESWLPLFGSPCHWAALDNYPQRIRGNSRAVKQQKPNNLIHPVLPIGRIINQDRSSYHTPKIGLPYGNWI